MSRSHAGHQCRNQTSLSRMGCMLHAVRMWFLSRWTHMRELTEKHRGPLPKTNTSILTRSPRSSSITNTSILTHSPAQPVLLRFVCVCVCVCGGGGISEVEVSLGKCQSSWFNSVQNETGENLHPGGLRKQMGMWEWSSMGHCKEMHEPGDLVSLHPEGRLTDTEGGCNTDFECDFFGGWAIV